MEPIFALDIGTRMVMGLVMTKNKEQGYEILASAKTEHKQRAMYDGQVHDVNEVARAVIKVKEALEKKLDMPLKQVAVAAAGRALRTEVACAEHKEPLPVRWEREDVLALEMEAVHLALRQLQSSTDDDAQSYHCVGYSPIAWWNEGEEISNLIGQRGKVAKVSVIATFLPRTVVDGLVAVLSQVGLEMTSLTLEPIAAGQAAIPLNMRRLNLALVDIGAGTADIALTRNGSFFAYGMVPMAGDEVTEAICTHYLLDFKVGEKVKREINTKAQLNFKDFLGAKVVAKKEDVLNVIRSVVGKLAESISKEILILNNDVPQAIILIGGGSLTPMLSEMVAETLGIPQNRVGIQVRERLGEIFGEKSLKGPESITPIGIGIAALEGKGLQYYSVTVNNTIVSIFEIQLATVAEALLAAGILPRSFFGKPGAALTFEWNCEMRVIKGTLGSPAQLSVNGIPGKLEQALKAGDQITFIPGEPGKDAQVSFKEVLPPHDAKWILWNGQREIYAPQVLVNDQLACEKDTILDGCKITYIPNDDLKNLLKQKGYNLQKKEEIEYGINGEAHKINLDQEILVNGCRVEDSCTIYDGDSIEVNTKQIMIGELDLLPRPLIFSVNGVEIEFPPQETIISFRGQPVSENQPLKDGMDLRVQGFKRMPILSDLLPYVKFPKEVPSGSSLKLKVNGQMAEFTTVLHPGDRVTAIWD
ncbi:cell division FtsA domain-containing protein [Desulfosporosinus sp. OT]|uniref:cell division FtsA domain-containing protein n=1 Tax=Desulfosporosinus sp. OT TaxID=913865 RepID=UPI0002239D2C|nr:cell division FtsA domain-containing protein [Desulfosporosinus sp. OT]EGW38083.1 ATPases of the HSP70 class involved in cell division [Desulfosporosinus sp. OT]